MTIKELLNIQQNDGINTIAIQKNIDGINECVDDYTGFFSASKRVEPIISEMSGSFVAPLKRAVDVLRVYENRILNEEKITPSAVRIIAYDAHKFLSESYNLLTANKRAFREMDKTNISKVYSSVLFELNALCRKHDIFLEDIIKDESLIESVSNDMSIIMNEVL